MQAEPRCDISNSLIDETELRPPLGIRTLQGGLEISVKLEFHNADTDTDILARILADASDTRD